MMAALTKDQIAARRLGIGGSDAAKIMGTDEDWHALWLEKTGRAEGADLSHVFAVQLGHATEPLNLDWYELTTGHLVTRRGEVVVCPDYAMLRCTLDGYDAARPAVIQAKHVNGFSKLPDVLARYTPQVTHEMICTETPNGLLSVIVGTNEPAVLEVPYDEFYANEYIDRCRRFWAYVVEDREPAGAPAPIAPPTPIELMRVVDMQGSNQWAALADDWLTNEPAAKKFDKAVKGLKGLIEADVREASGHGLVATRDGRGVTIKRS